MDVCDDADYSQMLKGYTNKAIAAGVPAITSAGQRPSLSSSALPTLAGLSSTKVNDSSAVLQITSVCEARNGSSRLVCILEEAARLQVSTQECPTSWQPT